DRGPGGLGPRRRRRRRHRSHHRPARCTPRHPGAGLGGHGARADRLDGRAALRSRGDEPQRRRHPRGDARQRDDRARAAGARRVDGAARRRRREPGPPRALHPHRRGHVRGAARRRRDRRPHLARRNGRDRGARRRPSRGVVAQDPRRPPRRASPGRPAADALPAVPLPARPGAAGHKDARRLARPGARAVTAAESRATSIESLLATKEIVIFCGSGGVGKTSVAAAAGVAAATRLGGKVLVLTIDPARRLANALGLEDFGNVEKPVPVEAFKAAGLETPGQLHAAMLDTKRSWDELVLRHAPDEETAYRILENRLYTNITGRFVQSHDYIAMERLFDVHAAGRYDLIIIDTPPTRNAIDFLEAPKRMADFFGGRLLRWLPMPYRMGGRRGARVLNVASRPFYQLADRILGSQFLQDIAEFFLSFQSMYDGFARRAEA